MRKYKNQTIISVIGLAVGFTCFALATLWIRYELSYDNFHKDADRLYVVYQPDGWNGGKTNTSVYPVAGYLKETFPEVEDALSIVPPFSNEKVFIEEAEHPANRYFGVDLSRHSRCAGTDYHPLRRLASV
ncbi:hypothetical protein AGMMS50262_11850 [Bacteroidia bacterium]|nr:hypothetical protein AGMMS50262_11850 [Bacteroidia bacterium]